MKKSVVAMLVFVGVFALAAFFFNVTKFTGNTTLTSNANYGPINKHNFLYVDCVYLSDNDGWGVITNAKVKYFNRLKGLEIKEGDSCLSSSRVRELDCLDGYMVERKVTCPPSMVCKEGICVTPKI